MTTPLYITFEKRIDDAIAQIIQKQIEPWVFLNTGNMFQVSTFNGRNISYQGIMFEGSPQNIFWSRYIEPFLENLVVEEIRAAVEAATLRKIDARLLLPEVEGLLLSSCNRVFSRMARIDQLLLGNSASSSVRSIDNEVSNMKEFIHKHINAELQMWRSRPRYEEWYEKNKFLIWVLGTIVTIAGIAVKFM